MNKLSAARANVAAVVKKLEADAPYLDYTDFKAHGRIATGLLDGKISAQDLREVRSMPARAAGYVANAEHRAADVDGLRREIAIANVDQAMARSDIADVWLVYRPSLLDDALPKVTAQEIEQRAAYYHGQADWYREGEGIAHELVSAVEAQVKEQPLSMMVLETLKDVV